MESIQIVNTESAARLVGLSSSTLAKYRLTGDGPQFLKVGRSVRYRIADLEAWLSGKAKSSTSQNN